VAALLIVGAGLVVAPSAVTAQTAPTTSAAERVPGSGAKEERLASENRRMIAVIAGLVVVALALTVLTIRYIRVTKPEARAPAPVGRHGRGAAAPGAEPAVAAVGAPAAPTTPVSEPSPADHGGADVDWEPRGTGEHDRVEVGAATGAPRPRRADRAAALARAQG
jgi:hypothetical protein